MPLADATARHDEAVATHNRLSGLAGEAGRAATSAAARSQNLIETTAAGGPAVDADTLLALDAGAMKAGHAADVARATAQGANVRREHAELALRLAEAADHLGRVRIAIAAEITAAERVDGSIAAAKAAIIELQDAAAETQRVCRAAVAFDARAADLPRTNAQAAELHASVLPKTGVTMQGVADRYSTRLLWADNNGGLHVVVNGLAYHRRSIWGQLAPPPAPDAAVPQPGSPALQILPRMI
jgi:hypothetical protein